MIDPVQQAILRGGLRQAGLPVPGDFGTEMAAAWDKTRLDAQYDAFMASLRALNAR